MRRCVYAPWPQKEPKEQTAEAETEEQKTAEATTEEQETKGTKAEKQTPQVRPTPAPPHLSDIVSAPTTHNPKDRT